MQSYLNMNVASCVSEKFLTKNKQHDDGYIHQIKVYTSIQSVYIYIFDDWRNDTKWYRFRGVEIEKIILPSLFQINQLLVMLRQCFCLWLEFCLWSVDFVVQRRLWCSNAIYFYWFKNVSPKTRQRRGFTVPEIVNS